MPAKKYLSFPPTIGAILSLGFASWGLASWPASESKNHLANRLAKETSPYLLMHAHNPVDWYPWGPEAFAKAKKEGKLVFLSIGYSSCYWCHVMERESFENPEVAKLLNQWFVSIKVDREERPEIDSSYMTALNVLGQSGGWPLSMFLTSSGNPIVGGTYWPPDDRADQGRKYRGFKNILTFMHEWNADKPAEVQGQADRLAEMTRDALAGVGHGVPIVGLDRRLVTAAVDSLVEEFDPIYGGFGSASRKFQGPKFPVPSSLNLILAVAEGTQSAKLLGIATLSLDKMAQGGIYDHLGGGFHRYSTERTWTVPHFEKLLYDNAQLLEVYSEAFRLTGKPLYRQVVQETVAFILREMTAPAGGFYSAIDAETGAEEGRYYVWTDREIEIALANPKDVAFFKKVYGADQPANLEAKYHVLYLPKSLEALAQEFKETPEQLTARLALLRQQLLMARAARPHPFLDTKVLTGWNGQMIAGLAMAGKTFHKPQWIEVAGRAADFVVHQLRTKEGRLARTYSAQPTKNGEARLNAYLDDYAYLVHGLLCLYDVTGAARWLDEAKALTDTMVRLHEDPKAGGFFFTSSDHEKLFARSKDQFDSAQPAGNSVAADNLVRLWIKTGDARYQTLADKTFKAFAAILKSNPSNLPAMALALGRYLNAQKAAGQVVVALNQNAPGGGATRSDNVVHIKGTAGKVAADGKQELTLELKVDAGWHTYANPVPTDFPGIPTTVTVSAKTKPKEVKIDYPKGTFVKDEFAGDHYVYEGAVTIKATIQRAAGDTRPLVVSVKIQACNKDKCLVPGTVKLTLE